MGQGAAAGHGQRLGAARGHLEGPAAGGVVGCHGAAAGRRGVLRRWLARDHPGVVGANIGGGLLLVAGGPVVLILAGVAVLQARSLRRRRQQPGTSA
jgi:hypothetical protein